MRFVLDNTGKGEFASAQAFVLPLALFCVLAGFLMHYFRRLLREIRN